MTFSVDKKIKVSFFSAFFILLISYFLFVFATDKILKRSFEEKKRNEIIGEEANLLSTLKDMETVYRGFLLINNKESLDLYFNGKKKVENISRKLRIYFDNDSLQLRKLLLVNSSINSKIGIMQHGLNLYVEGGFLLTDSIKDLAVLGKLEMDNIRQQIDEMQITQYQLNSITSATSGAADAIKIINIIAFIIFILIILYCFSIYRKDIKNRKIASEQSFNYREELEKKVKILSGVNDQLAEDDTIEKFAASGRMARMIAHEVRNPLTNIGLANDQLKDVVEISEESSMLMNMIRRNGERINVLIGDLLNATKFGELHCQNVSINNLLDEVLLGIDSKLEQQHILVKKNYSQDLCEILADPEKIKIVFRNVILNSIEAIYGPNGIIEISTAIFEKQCVIEIKDNGGGIEESSLPKLFEPYFSSKNKGNGLGLTNAQNIILNHHGKIKVESVHSKGSCFTISLPCI